VSNSIEDILIDQQTEPFIPPPSVVEETGWRTWPVKSISKSNKLLESSKDDMNNQQSVSPFSQDDNGNTVHLDRVNNEVSNSIEDILIDQQTEPFIPPPSVVEETGWRTWPVKSISKNNKLSESSKNDMSNQQSVSPFSQEENGNTESSSSDAKNTHSSEKDISDIRSTLDLSKPTGNDIEDVTEASQMKEEEEVQIKVLLKKKTTSQSDSHVNK